VSAGGEAEVAVENGRDSRCFSRQGGRQTVAELRGIGAPDEIAGVAGVRCRVDHAAPERRSRLRVEVVERLRHAEGEAGELDERAVGVEANASVISRQRGVRSRSRDVAGADAGARATGAVTERDIAAHRAVLGLVTGVRGDVATHLRTQVSRGPRAVLAGRQRAVGGVSVVPPGVINARPAADFQAHIGARDVIEPRTIQTANLHVLDRLGLYGKIGGPRPRQRNKTRCGAEEEAFYQFPSAILVAAEAYDFGGGTPSDDATVWVVFRRKRRQQIIFMSDGLHVLGIA